MAIMTKNDTVTDIQNFWTADALEKVGIDMKTTDFNNHTTGVPDGLLGGGTSTLLQTLIILAQKEAGIDEANITTELTDDNFQHIATLLEGRGFSGDEVSAYMDSMIELVSDTNLTALYDEKATVSVADANTKIDHSKLPVAEPEPVAPNTGPGPIMLSTTDLDEESFADSLFCDADQNPFEEIIGINIADVNLSGDTGHFTQVATTESAANEPVGETINMTTDYYEKLSHAENITDSMQAKIDAFPAALELAQKNAGLDKAEETLQAATERKANFSTEWQEVKSEYQAVEQEYITLRDNLKAEEMTFTFTVDGNTETAKMSLNEIEDKDGWFDSDIDQAIYDAGRAEYERIAAASDMQNLLDKSEELHQQYAGGGLSRDVNTEYNDAANAVAQIKMDVNEMQIAVVLPVEQQPEQQTLMASTSTPIQGLGGT